MEAPPSRSVQVSDVSPAIPRSPPPWLHPTGLEAVLQGFATDRRVARHCALDATLPARAGSFAAIPEALHQDIRRTLNKRGIERLFAHQVQSFQAVSQGQHVVVATPTASGKSLCYNLPVLQQLKSEPHGCALYIFPTKALARDQEEALRRLLRDCNLASGAITFDGDTPGDARRAARQRSGVILTNPDMLHAGILPHHAAWARFFANLKVVVIDELHIYRGVFGSHLANVLRRLRRIARFHGSNPTFVFASATIGNPKEHATVMLGDDVTLVDENGAPQGPRRVVFYNPPVVNAELGVRESYIKAAVKLTLKLVRAQVPTLVFGQSRNNVEIMLKYLRDRLRGEIAPESIHAYRGGYLPKTRRQIEAGLRDGAVRCVVATNALELGIDIGMLDAVVCAGYPGSMAGLWQRFGRAGRRGEQSLAVLVASSAPYDQFFAANPELLLDSAIEHARIDPNNLDILMQHLKCAAFELPFAAGERFGDVPAAPVQEGLDYLAGQRVLHPVISPDGVRTYHWASDAYPANHVSLRSIGWDNVVIIDASEALQDAPAKVLGEMDWRSAHTMLHAQAIYQHQGEQFQVEKLDLENRKAFVRGVEPDYYTEAMTYKRISVIHQEEEQFLKWNNSVAIPCGLGEVSVVEKVVGYKKIKFYTHENVGYGEVHLPEMQMHTVACWFTVPHEVIRSLDFARPLVVDALRGFAKALHTVACVGLMIDPRDLGHTLQDPLENGEHQSFDPTLFLYDAVPGGVGLSSRLYNDASNTWLRARTLVLQCRCQEGCPACIGPSLGGSTDVATQDAAQAVVESESQVPRKAIVLQLLERLGIGEALRIVS